MSNRWDMRKSIRFDIIQLMPLSFIPFNDTKPFSALFSECQKKYSRRKKRSKFSFLDAFQIFRKAFSVFGWRQTSRFALPYIYSTIYSIFLYPLLEVLQNLSRSGACLSEVIAAINPPKRGGFICAPKTIEIFRNAACHRRSQPRGIEDVSSP